MRLFLLQFILSSLYRYGFDVKIHSLWADEDSLSEEEQGPLVLDQTWRGDPDSEADSIDSDHEDPLK